MRRLETIALAAACAAATACTATPKGDTPPPSDSTTASTSTGAAGGTTTNAGTNAGTSMGATTGAAAGANGDADRAAASGTGVPAGYLARTDRPNQNVADAKYAMSGGRWDVTTGPAHVVYAAKDSARGAYTATTTIDQLAAPSHPEAYGLVIGGTDLQGAGQRYTYFIVRGTGEYAVKVRDGAAARSVVDFTASPAVPKADAAGKASYALGAQVTADSVRFMVNGKTVRALPKAGLFTDGVAGVRVNHNLHVLVTPVAISK